MSSYKIERIDAILQGNSITKIPIIYVKPDPAFLEFVRLNKMSVLCEIKGTGQYNGTISGVVKRSSEVLGCRPNYFAETGYYVIILDLGWHGYPKSLGTVVFKGLKGPMTQAQYDVATKMTDENSDDPVEKVVTEIKNKLFSTPGIVSLVFIGLILVILVTYSMAKGTHRK